MWAVTSIAFPCPGTPSPLLRDVGGFRSCSEGSVDGGGGTGGRMERAARVVRPNPLTPDTDVTNLAQTKTPTTAHLILTTRA